ncbi:MAG: tetratricopeptide repeat protein [Candidatus Binatia bacterium]
MRNRPGQGPTPMSPGRSRRWATALLLLGMTFLAYLPATRGGYIWDDKRYITENVTLRSTEGLRQIWFEPQSTAQHYYPVLLTAFWMQFRLWGVDPLGYHITNIALHAVNAVLVWLLLSRLSLPGAFLAAALFALHPVHVESVAWITELKNVLSGTFSLLTLLAWMRFLGTRQWQGYALTLFLFLCAMLSKTAVGALPLILLLLAWWKGPNGWRHELWRVVPFLAISGVLGLITVWKEHLGGDPGGLPPPLSLAEQGLLAGRALGFYAGKLLWPATLMLIYPRWEIDAHAPWQYAFPLAALAVPLGLWWFRQRIGRAPLVAVLSFTIALGPALGFVPFDFMRLSYVADHFQYLASIGLIGLVAGAVVQTADRLGLSQRWMGIAGAGVVLLALGVLTWHQGRLYQDEATLWRDNLAKNSQAWMAHFGLGNVLARRGALKEAVTHYRQAVQINPADGSLHNNLGNVLVRRGELKEAVKHYRQAVQINPTDAEAHSNLGLALARRGKLVEAVRHYRRALQINPADALVHNNLGNALVRRGELEEAIRHYRQAVKLSPVNSEFYFNLGNALVKQERLDEAVGQFQQAVKIKPDFAEAYHHLGRVVAAQGHLDKAIEYFRQALRIQPEFAKAHESLGQALAEQGKRDEAVKHYEEALRIMKSSREASGQR